MNKEEKKVEEVNKEIVKNQEEIDKEKEKKKKEKLLNE